MGNIDSAISEVADQLYFTHRAGSVVHAWDAPDTQTEQQNEDVETAYFQPVDFAPTRRSFLRSEMPIVDLSRYPFQEYERERHDNMPSCTTECQLGDNVELVRLKDSWAIPEELKKTKMGVREASAARECFATDPSLPIALKSPGLAYYEADYCTRNDVISAVNQINNRFDDLEYGWEERNYGRQVGTILGSNSNWNNIDKTNDNRNNMAQYAKPVTEQYKGQYKLDPNYNKNHLMTKSSHNQDRMIQRDPYPGSNSQMHSTKVHHHPAQKPSGEGLPRLSRSDSKANDAGGQWTLPKMPKITPDILGPPTAAQNEQVAQQRIDYRDTERGTPCAQKLLRTPRVSMSQEDPTPKRLSDSNNHHHPTATTTTTTSSSPGLSERKARMMSSQVTSRKKWTTNSDHRTTSNLGVTTSTMTSSSTSSSAATSPASSSKRRARTPGRQKEAPMTGKKAEGNANKATPTAAAADSFDDCPF